MTMCKHGAVKSVDCCLNLCFYARSTSQNRIMRWLNSEFRSFYDLLTCN